MDALNQSEENNDHGYSYGEIDQITENILNYLPTATTRYIFCS